MTDQEVGELWRKHKLPIVGDLIRKLVEERARAYKLYDMVAGRERYDKKYNREKVKQSLRDFGIDPVTWPNQLKTW